MRGPLSRLLALALLLCLPSGLLVAADEVDDAALRKAVTFYASFDEAPRGDFGDGGLSLSTRSNHETEKGKFVFTKGFDEKAFRIARNKGIHGGALECTDVLPPHSGRRGTRPRPAGSATGLEATLSRSPVLGGVCLHRRSTNHARRLTA